MASPAVEAAAPDADPHKLDRTGWLQSLEKNPTFPDDFIRRIPKADLHVHLDGSLRISTIIELAQEAGVELPAYTVAELKEKVFKDKYSSLEEYLECFKYTTAVMRTPAHLERVAYEFACDNYNEGVLYFEVRFAPQLHAGNKMSIEGVLVAVDAGLRRARDEYNDLQSVKQGVQPPHEYAIIVCAMRCFNAFFSEYYKNFCEIHANEPEERQFGLASVALVASACDAKDKHSLPIVGIDIAGAERGFPADTHEEAYRYAQKRFLSKTVHAGESYGAESIFQALTELNAQRIGHGYNLFYADKIENPEVLMKKFGLTPQQFVDKLAQYVAESRITLEVCLSSNLQTLPELKGDPRNHPLIRMLEARLAASLHTDNRLVSNTTVSREIRIAADAFDLSPKQMKDMILGAFKGSFFPRGYTFKRRYVRRIIDYYDAIEKEFGIHEIDDGRRTRLDSYGSLDLDVSFGGAARKQLIEIPKRRSPTSPRSRSASPVAAAAPAEPTGLATAVLSSLVFVIPVVAALMDSLY